MTPQEIQARAEAKVGQIMGLAKILHLHPEVRERVTNEGFIEKTIYWIDSEKYPEAEPATSTGEAETPAAPEEEIAPEVQEVALPEEETV